MAALDGHPGHLLEAIAVRMSVGLLDLQKQWVIEDLLGVQRLF